MPGIVGIITDRAAADCELLVRSMLSSMTHERFYVSGAYCVPEMRVYAGWIAHEDSLPAAQPFLNQFGDIVLLFSGECFTDSQLQAAAPLNGHGPAKNSGHWLVHLYEEHGERFFERLNGLFSGLLIDKRRR